MSNPLLGGINHNVVNHTEGDIGEWLSRGEFNVKAYGASGTGATDDTQAFVNAITACSAAGGGVVFAPRGNYDVSSTITLASKVKLRLHPAAVLIPQTSFNVVTMANNSQLVGGIIRTSGVSGFSHAAIYFDGSQQFSFTGEVFCLVSDVILKGTTGAGYGIHMYADGSSEYVAGVHIRNVNIDDFQDGIRLECIDATGTQFINGNHFNNIIIDSSTYQVRLIGGGTGTTYEVSGNYFDNVMTQTGASTTMALYCEGHRNYFTNFDIWDWEDGAGYAADTPAVKFSGSKAVYNYMLCNMIGYRFGMVLDEGVWGNTVVGSGTQFQPQISCSIPPVYTRPSYNGIHSNFLAFADKRFTVTQTAGSAPTSGSLANLFDDNPTSSIRWTSASTFPVTVNIDFGTDVNYIHAVACQFDEGYCPAGVKIEMYDTSAAEWLTLIDTSGSLQAQVIANVYAEDYTTIGVGISQMRVTLSGVGSGVTTIKWFKLMMFGCESFGELWLSRGGDTLYGDVTWNDVLEGPVVVTPDGAHTYRLGVDNSGNVISTLVT